MNLLQKGMFLFLSFASLMVCHGRRAAKAVVACRRVGSFWFTDTCMYSHSGVYTTCIETPVDGQAAPKQADKQASRHVITSGKSVTGARREGDNWDHCLHPLIENGTLTPNFSSG